MPILDGVRAKVTAAWSINSRVRSTTAAGTVSVSHACRNVRQDITDLHPLGDECNDAHVAATIVLLLAQRHIVKGLTAGAVK